MEANEGVRSRCAGGCGGQAMGNGTGNTLSITEGNGRV